MFKTANCGSRLVQLVLGLALAAMASGCIPSSPTYPFDIFPEMHYSPAVRQEEPPRLGPPPESVPVTGRAPRYEPTRAAALTNPVPATPENLRRARELYEVNCRPCHGPDGHGNGFMSTYFRQAGLAPPVDFAGPQERELSDGQIWYVIGAGIRGMPPFDRLLTGDERWLMVDLIRSEEGR